MKTQLIFSLASLCLLPSCAQMPTHKGMEQPVPVTNKAPQVAAPPETTQARYNRPEINLSNTQDQGPDSCTQEESAQTPFVVAQEPVEPEGTGEEFSKKYDLERYQRMLDTALELCKSAQELWENGKNNKALNALDEAYSLILKVAPDSRPELIQQKEDLRFLIAKRIMEIHASRFTIANGLHTEIPLIVNAEIMDEIKQFQGPERQFFLRAYRRSGRYRPMIVKALKEAGLPEELSWLPLIESGYKVRALSRARALGLWQFIASTGYKYGLNRDTWIDERLDPVKSTQAAIKYLTELHQIFGDWMTVLAAYNCGEGTVLRAIRHQKLNYLDHFWDLYQMLPRETARYVPRFIATLLIIKEPEKYGFNLADPAPPLNFEKVTVKKQLHLGQIAKALGVSKESLKELNPELRYEITPPKPYKLKVPVGKKEIFIAKLKELESWTLPQKAFVYHRVRRGDTLSSIALRYGAKVRDIILANNLRHANLIRIGQRLKVPIIRGSNDLKPPTHETKRRHYRSYVVKKGDSLWLIARRFKTSVSIIKRANRLRSNCLSVGQVLRIPR